MSQSTLSNPFVDQYSRELNRMSNRIYSHRPDYIVAITRSGPRLLELLEKDGIFNNDATIITEKSLDFIPSRELKDKSVVVFDDVVNTGRTIFTVRDKVERYDVDHVGTVSFAYDIDTGQVPIDSVEPQLELETSKRYELVKNLTQSFSHLNKPYDVDHPIFHFDIDESTINTFEGHPNSYDISTVHSTQYGYNKYSFFPGEKSGIHHIIDSILDVNNPPVDIEKSRVYYNSQSPSFVLVPITSFPISEGKMNEVEIFSDKVPEIYNDIMRAVERELDGISTNVYRPDKAVVLYRVLWYLVNYIYGIGYQLEYGDVLPSTKNPKDTLSDRDIQYLFGPTISTILLESLDDNHRKIKKAVENIIEENKNIDRNTGGQNRRKRDKNQSDLYNGLISYVSQNTNSKMTYSDQLSSIFEGTQLVYESDTEDELKESEGEIPKRLERVTGLNVHQMVNLLEDAGIESVEGSEQGYSLALDFLVDAGVAIPMFYHGFSDSDEGGYLERAYRHGEGALNRMGYSYVVDSVVEELMEYAENEGGNLTRIGLEKIGVMITDRLHNGRYWGQATTSSIYDFLSGDNINRELNIAPEYYRHGKVVLIEDQPDLEQDFFTDWCEQQDIINSQNGAIKRGPGWKHRHKNDIDQVESTISSAEKTALENLAILLYDIDRIVDDSSDNDYLTALTTCRDRLSYVKSLHAVIELYFANRDWRIQESITKAREVCDQAKSLNSSAFVDRDLSEQFEDLKEAREKSSKSHQAINELLNKKKLRRKFKKSEIITDVREHFGNHPDRHYRKNYEQNLEPFLDHIEKVSEVQGPEAEKLVEKVEIFGEICIKFSEMYRNVLYISAQIANKNSDLRSNFAELYDSIDKFNNILDRYSELRYSGTLISDIPKIDISSVRIECMQKREFKKEVFEDSNKSIILIQDLLTQVITSHDVLSDIYTSYFKRTSWNRKIEGIFHEEPMIDANWVVWYDIKGSSNPKNESSAETLKQNLNQGLEELSSNIDDGEFKKSDDDEKHIFVREAENVEVFLENIIREAAMQNMYMRMSVCSVPSGEIERSPYNHIKGNEAHVRAVRVGNFLSKENKEEDGYHYLSLTKGVENQLWEDNTLPPAIAQDYNSIETIEEEVPMKDPDITISFTTHKLQRQK